jgi:thiamine monophosphate synthase
LRKYASKGRPLPKDRWLAASCHNAEELALAELMDVDFVTLSPVQPTQTHPMPSRWVGNRRGVDQRVQQTGVPAGWCRA